MADVSSEVAYLQSLPSVRERCSKVFELAESNQLDYWDVNLSKEADVVDFTCDLIKVSLGEEQRCSDVKDRVRAGCIIIAAYLSRNLLVLGA